jgi:hypothetical protein
MMAVSGSEEQRRADQPHQRNDPRHQARERTRDKRGLRQCVRGTRFVDVACVVMVIPVSCCELLSTYRGGMWIRRVVGFDLSDRNRQARLEGAALSHQWAEERVLAA